MDEVKQRLLEAIVNGVEILPKRTPRRLGLQDVRVANMSDIRMPEEHRGAVFHAFDPVQTQGPVTGRFIPERRLDDAGIDPHVDTDAVAAVDHPFRIPTYSARRIEHEGVAYWWYPRLYTPEHHPLSILTNIHEGSVLDFARDGLLFLDALHTQGLIHTDPRLSNFIARPVGDDGEAIQAELLHYDADPEQWIAVCEERGPIQLEEPYAVDLETTIREGSELKHFKTTYFDEGMQERILTASPSTDIFLFDQTVRHLANRSQGAGRKVWRELQQDAERYYGDSEKRDVLHVEDQLRILNRPERNRRRWKTVGWITIGLLTTTFLSTVAQGVKHIVDQFHWNRTETVAVQSLLAADSVKAGHVGRLAEALARKVEARVKEGIHPTTYPFMSGSLKDYVDDPNIVPPQVPARYMRGGDIVSLPVVYEWGGANTEILYLASMVPGIDPDVRRAARANAYAQALWILRSDTAHARGMLGWNGYTEPLLTAFDDTGDPVLLEAARRAGDLALGRLQVCETGSFIPYSGLASQPSSCIGKSSDIQSVDALLTASQASVRLGLPDPYLPAAISIARDFERLLQQDSIPAVARFSEGRASGRWQPLANALAARTYFRLGSMISDDSLLRRSKELIQQNLDGRIASYLSGLDEMNSYADAVSLEVAALHGMEPQALEGELRALSTLIPSALVRENYPFDTVVRPEKELLNSTCLNISALERDGWCDIGYPPAEAAFLAGLIYIAHQEWK